MSRQDTPKWQAAIVPSTTAFFLDVDGTLLGFKDRPEDVVADDALLSLLGRLQTASGGAVALVSGRMVSDLDRITSPFVIPAAGVHGADLRFADGRRKVLDDAALEEVRAAAQRFVDGTDGLRFEDKGGSTFAIHFRQRPEQAEHIALFLEDAILGRDLMVQHGKMVAEVKSKSCHKGMAIQAFMRTPPFFGKRPLFMGDDLTDEHGFEAVNEQDGIAIKIGSAAEKTVARYRLADIVAVRGLLELIC